MDMPATHRRWTRAEVKALIDANPRETPRYELVDGELLVTPSPVLPHQRAVRELVVALHAYLRENLIGEVLGSPSDVELEDDTIVQPDVYVIPAEPFETVMPGQSLLLAIEVISPGSARGDRGPKRALYQRHVPEYWIVDLDAALFERWRPGDERPEILREHIDWWPAGASAAFQLVLPGFFARVTPAVR